MTRLLSEKHIEKARRDGFVCPVPVMGAAEAARYLDCFEDFERVTGESAPNHLKVKPHTMLRWMLELGATSAVLDAIEDLIGPDIMLVTSAVWAKNAHDPHFVTWHQDSAYFGYEPMDVWGAWIGLTDSRAENGCLKYLPGTHLVPEMAHTETFDELNLLQRGQRIDEIDESRAVLAEVAAGEATIHHFRVAHASEPNLSAARRIGILFVYCPPYVRPTLGRYPAMLVRGENNYDHWDEDPAPKRDLDPDAVAYFESFLTRYNDPEVRSEAERD